MPSLRLILRFLGVGSLGALIACLHVRHPIVHEPRAVATLASVEAPLKVHSRAGTVHQLAQWRFDPADSVAARARTVPTGPAHRDRAGLTGYAARQQALKRRI